MNDCGQFLDFLFLNRLIQNGIINLQHSSGEVITFNFVQLKMLNIYQNVPSVDFKNHFSYLKEKVLKG